MHLCSCTEEGLYLLVDKCQKNVLLWKSPCKDFQLGENNLKKLLTRRIYYVIISKLPLSTATEIAPWQINSNATLKIPKTNYSENKEPNSKDRISQKETGRTNRKVPWRAWEAGHATIKKTWEFDPGSGWTLAACLTHASRTDLYWSLAIYKLVADGWVTRG